MEGAAMANRRAYDIAIAAAWHTEAFARTKKLPKLSSILTESGDKPKSVAAQALAFFHQMKAKGIPIEIRRVPRNG
jgi:hypothetical protein